MMGRVVILQARALDIGTENWRLDERAPRSASSLQRLSVLLRQLGLHAFDVEVHRCQVLGGCGLAFGDAHLTGLILDRAGEGMEGDRKSTRLNSSHVKISYAVFCLKKKKKSIGSVDK